MTDIDIYAAGPLSMSVCAPEGMPGVEVEDRVNAKSPPGGTLKWFISEDEFFKDGTTPNGGIVECHNGTTRHWLLHC